MTRKTAFFDGWSWFKLNNLGLALGTNFKFYTSVEKVLKLKVRQFWGLIPMFVEVTGEKTGRKGILHPLPILNRVKLTASTQQLSFSSSCFFKAAKFWGEFFSEQSLFRRGYFQNSYFSRPKLLPSSLFRAVIFSGQLLFGGGTDSE